MDGNIMVSAMLIFVSLPLLSLFPFINCSARIKDVAGAGDRYSDSFHEVLDCGFGSSLHQQEDQHIIAWEMKVSDFNSITEPKMALTFHDLYGNSTPTALSVCNLISNQQVLVIIFTLTSYETGMDDFIRKVPTPCGEPVLPKSKLETASSVLYMIRHTTEKVSCFRALFSSFKYWHKAFYEDRKFHRDDDIVTLNLTSLASHSRNQILWGLVEMDEASLSNTISLPLQWILSDDIGCKGALVGTENTLGGSFPYAEKAVFRVGVPVRSNITQFVSINSIDDNHTTSITGFSIGVFKAAVRRLPYKFTYKMIPFDGSSHELVKKVASKTFDVAVGDIVTTAGDYQPVEFSLPYLEPGFMMVVKAKSNELKNFWWFLSLFTPKMWVMIAAFNILMGAVVWIIEGRDEDGPNFIEVILFVFEHRRPLQTSAARLVKAVWMLVMLIMCQTYTSYLNTLLANSQQEPSIDVNSMKWRNAAIGCDGQSQTIYYLVKVLGFKRRNIRVIASIDNYAEALSSGNIKAAFLLTPYAEFLLAKHCADLTEIKPTYDYNLGGFGFVFPKGSPLISDISAAILELEESGELQQMEEEMSSFAGCSRKLFDEDATIRPIEPRSFLGLFVTAGVASAVALLITLIDQLNRHWEGRVYRLLMGRELWVLLTRMHRMLIGRQL